MSHYPSSDWPPADGRTFVFSEEFGFLLIELVRLLSHRYPHMDFSDAVARVFQWFDGTLLNDPAFIGPPRFPTRQSFLAYLRQAVWNAARLAERERRRRHFIAPLPEGQSIIVREIPPDEQAELQEAVDSLEEPHRSVFRRYFFYEEDLEVLASSFDVSLEKIYRIYTAAVDMLRDKLLGDQ